MEFENSDSKGPGGSYSRTAKITKSKNNSPSDNDADSAAELFRGAEFTLLQVGSILTALRILRSFDREHCCLLPFFLDEISGEKTRIPRNLGALKDGSGNVDAAAAGGAGTTMGPSSVDVINMAA